MKNTQTLKLQELVGKAIEAVEVGTAHGEVLRITFSDGSKLNVCSVIGTDMEKQPGVYRDDILVEFNGEVL